MLLLDVGARLVFLKVNIDYDDGAILSVWSTRTFVVVGTLRVTCLLSSLKWLALSKRPRAINFSSVVVRSECLPGLLDCLRSPVKQLTCSSVVSLLSRSIAPNKTIRSIFDTC